MHRVSWVGGGVEEGMRGRPDPPGNVEQRSSSLEKGLHKGRAAGKELAHTHEVGAVAVCLKRCKGLWFGEPGETVSSGGRRVGNLKLPQKADLGSGGHRVQHAFRRIYIVGIASQPLGDELPLALALAQRWEGQSWSASCCGTLQKTCWATGTQP